MDHRTNYWAGKRVCVTGGTGFLGFHLVQKLRERDAEVRVLGLPPRGWHPLDDMPDVHTHYCDLRNAAFARRALQGVEVVFHTAGSVAIWGEQSKTLVDDHVQLTKVVLDQADQEATIVHTSSIVTTGGSPNPEALTEETPFTLKDFPVPYVYAKRAAEELALSRANRQRVVVVNPSYLIGPEDYLGSVMGRMCQRFWKGRLFFVPGSGLNYVDVRDAALGHLLAAERGQSGRRYILGGENRSFSTFLRILATEAGMAPRGLIPIPGWLMKICAWYTELRSQRTGREPYPSKQQTSMSGRWWYVNSTRAQEELGFTARPLVESIRDAYRWYSEQKRIPVRGFNAWWMRPKAARTFHGASRTLTPYRATSTRV